MPRRMIGMDEVLLVRIASGSSTILSRAAKISVFASVFSTTASTTSCRSARSSRAGRGTADRAAATAFVPGPSLSEALEGHGPWSPASVCVLGMRLAEALDAVHRAGLVHRDVKPGNLLLAPDGPRLIDFGIARTPEGTALTSTGVDRGLARLPVARTGPGARRGRSARPAMSSRWAASWPSPRPAYGRSAAARPRRCCCARSTTSPNCPGSRTALEPVVRACLDKDPARRPTAVEVGAALDAAVPADRERWLPEPVTRLIADRSATVLAMGAIEPTRVSAPASTARGDAVAVAKRWPGGLWTR